MSPRLVPWLYVFGAPLLWVLAGGWTFDYGWQLLAGILVIAVPVALLEVATLRNWGGWWGEKNDDGTPRYR